MSDEERPAGVRRISPAEAELPPAAPKEPALPLSNQQLGTIFAWTIFVVAVVVLILIF